MRMTSELKFRTRAPRSDSVILGALLQVNRGILLIIFNLTLFIEFGRSRSIPGLDVMAILPPSIYFLIGFIDILMVKRLWKGDLNGWRYGIAMSTFIALLTPFSFSILIFVTSYLMGLFLVIDLFAAAETIALLTLSARRFFRALSFL